MKKKQNLIESLCLYLGRQNFITELLDNFTKFLFPPSQLAFSGIGNASNFLNSQANEDKLLGKRGQKLMTRPPAGSENFHGNAPLTPTEKHGYEEPTRSIYEFFFGDSAVHNRQKTTAQKSQKHSAAACIDPKYKGMHGRPCKFAGGSDNMCPKGSASGWWWSYEVPKLGRIYYIDCCGGANASDVWCNWTSENNWCLVYGKAAALGITDYNCTLAILEKDMNVVKVGSGYEVVGVDPAP